MMKIHRKNLEGVAFAVAFITSIGVFINAYGVRINLTDSHVSKGLWKAVTADTIKVGDVIVFDIREFYKANPSLQDSRIRFVSPFLMKRVAAVAGSIIERSGDVVVIDGVEFRQSKIQDDSWLKTSYPLKVPVNTVWIMADKEFSYDSRYHGPLSLDLVREKAIPLLTWKR
jgi:type IV secretory pathway protease TraF